MVKEGTLILVGVGVLALLLLRRPVTASGYNPALMNQSTDLWSRVMGSAGASLFGSFAGGRPTSSGDSYNYGGSYLGAGGGLPYGESDLDSFGLGGMGDYL